MIARFCLVTLVAVSVMLVGAQAQAVLLLDLADMVGGGDGTGTGTPNTGINPRNGSQVVGITSTNNPGTSNVYSTVAHPYIDGVFVPDGAVAGPAATQVTSTGLTTNFPNTDGQSWENGMGYNAGCCGGQLRIGGVVTNMFAAPHSGIGFHSNKGITFDLDAIRAATGLLPTRYTAWTDVRAGAGGNADIDHFVLLDGAIVAQSLNMTDDGSNARFFDVPISHGDRFLTLVGTNGADGNYSFDQGIIGDPTLTAVPEPSTVLIWSVLGIGVALGLGQHRRAQRRRAVRMPWSPDRREAVLGAVQRRLHSPPRGDWTEIDSPW